jgi:hypothetical protein
MMIEFIHYHLNFVIGYVIKTATCGVVAKSILAAAVETTMLTVSGHHLLGLAAKQQHIVSVIKYKIINIST